MDTRSWWPVVAAAASTVGCCAVVAALRTSSAAEQPLTEGSVSADAASPPTILLIRHGETDGNRTRTIQVPETPLSSKGMQQAERLALRLASCPLSRLLTSDLARARMTAEAVVARATVELELEPELAERNFGDWRGVKYDELKARGVDVMGAETAPPNGETWAVFHDRVAKVWSRMAALAAGEKLPVALVCHGLTARSILTRQVECPEVKAGVVNLGNTSVSVIVRGDDGVWRTTLTNCTKHLLEEGR
jgi:probable phosphoglycerate mutase